MSFRLSSASDVDEFLRCGHPEHRSDEIPGLVDDLGSRHQVADGASDRFNAIGEPRPVVQRNLHDCHARRQQRGKCRVWYVVTLLRCRSTTGSCILALSCAA